MARLALVAAVLALSLPSAGRAEPTRTSKRAPAAVELSRIALPQATWDQMWAGAMAQMEQQIVASSGSALPAGFTEALRAEFQQILSYDEMLDLQAGLFAKHYSEAEMQQLIAFYRTPLGQKTVRVMPEVMQDAMGQVQLLVSQRMPPMMERLQKRFAGEKASDAHAP